MIKPKSTEKCICFEEKPCPCSHCSGTMACTFRCLHCNDENGNQKPKSTDKELKKIKQPQNASIIKGSDNKPNPKSTDKECKNCLQPIDRPIENAEEKLKTGIGILTGQHIYNAVLDKRFKSIDLCNWCYSLLKAYRYSLKPHKILTQDEIENLIKISTPPSITREETKCHHFRPDNHKPQGDCIHCTPSITSSPTMGGNSKDSPKSAKSGLTRDKVGQSKRQAYQLGFAEGRKEGIEEAVRIVEQTPELGYADLLEEDADSLDTAFEAGAEKQKNAIISALKGKK